MTADTSSPGTAISPTRSRSRVVARLLAMLLVVVAIVAAPSSGPVVAQDDDSDPTQELVDRFAPIIMIKAQDGPCDADGEPYGPTPIDIVLDNPDVVLRQVGNGDPVLRVAPSAADLFGLSEGFYVDFPGSALNPECIYEQDFERYAAELPATVYAHVLVDDEAERVFVQYWFYWYYNDWNNKHESDWEGIVVEFEATTVAQALDTGPSRVGYAQHEGGERSDWDADKLEREGDRPVVYSSAGSHASYFDSGVYLGRSASEGFGCDDTSGPSERLAPEVILLPTEVTSADDPFAWLAFDGRWGERQAGPFNGPTGPADKERWLEPAEWFDELRPSSVVIPAADAGGDTIVGTFCGVVESGSGVLLRVINSPGLMALAALGLFLLGRWLVRRTEWSSVAATPVVARRRAGQILRAAVRTYGRSPHVFVVIGLIALPVGIATAVLTTLLSALPGIGPLLGLVEGAEGTSAVATGLARGVANVLAVVLVNAIVAVYLSGEERGVTAARAAIGRAASSWKPLLGAYVRSFVIVALLLFSIIGIPWAIRQVVRYQFISQAVVLEGRTGGDSLRRSTELVRGRWWHTATVAGVISITFTFVTVLAGLLLLIAATGVPLWLFGLLYGLLGMLLMPLAGIALTLLYGDAVAEHGEESPDEPGAVDASSELGDADTVVPTDALR